MNTEPLNRFLYSSPNGVADWLAQSLPSLSKVVAIPNQVNPLYGAGRICQTSGNLSLEDAIKKIKDYTGMPDVRVAIATSGSLKSAIKRFAVCAGSGASVLKEIKEPIDLFITGEMSHHECLDAIHRNTSVIALNHSNSERGYLSEFKTHLEGLLNDAAVKVLVSETDEDPLATY